MGRRGAAGRVAVRGSLDGRVAARIDELFVFAHFLSLGRREGLRVKESGISELCVDVRALAWLRGLVLGGWFDVLGVEYRKACAEESLETWIIVNVERDLDEFQDLDDTSANGLFRGVYE